MEPTSRSKSHRYKELKVLVLGALVLIPQVFILAPLARGQTAGSTPPVLLTSEQSTYPLVPKDFSQRHKPPIILTVDGFSMEAYGGIYDDWSGYLANALKESLNIQRMRADIEPFAWSGDIKDTDMAVQALRTTYIPALVSRAKRENRPFIIVGHSWGGVLAYRALHESETEGKLKIGDVALLTTLGTPLNAQQELFGRIAGAHAQKHIAQIGEELLKPRSVETWSNYWTERDNISGPIPVASNVELPNSPGLDHSSYYKNPQYLEMVGAEIAVAVAKRAGTRVVENPSTAKGDTAPIVQSDFAPIVSFAANPGQIKRFEFSTLVWKADNTDYCKISGGTFGRFGPNDSLVVYPRQTTTYAVTCVGPGGYASQLVTVTVTE